MSARGSRKTVQGLHLARAQYLKAKETSYPWNQLSPNDHRWYFNAFSFPKCQSSHTVSGPKDNSVCTCPSPFLRQITHSRFTTRWINQLPDLGENISAWLLHTAFSFPLPIVLWLGLSLLQPELCRTFPLEIPSVSIFPTSYFFLNFSLQAAVKRGNSTARLVGRDERDGNQRLSWCQICAVFFPLLSLRREFCRVPHSLCIAGALNFVDKPQSYLQSAGAWWILNYM